MATTREISFASGDAVLTRSDGFEVVAPPPSEIMKRRARHHKGLIIGGSIVLFAVLVAIFAPLIAPYDPYAQVLSERLIHPIWHAKGTWAHPLGTDGFGRDYLSRLIYGARVTLSVGFFAAMVSALIGGTIGVIGGYFGGRTDSVVMYLINVKLSLPPILVFLALVSIFGGTVINVILIIGLFFWERYAVVLRSVTQQIRAQDYVTAAQAVGASPFRIILSEVLPNLMNQLIVIASLEMAIVIIVEAILSFLGLGIRPPTPSWGLMVSEGRKFMFFDPYLITIPGLAIFVVVIAINMMGDGIRDVTAPEGRN